MTETDRTPSKLSEVVRLFGNGRSMPGLTPSTRGTPRGHDVGRSAAELVSTLMRIMAQDDRIRT